MAYHWYAMRTKPRKEEIVCDQLRNQQLEVFYPQLRVQPINPRARHLKPYFPGYLFVRLDLDQRSMSNFQWMPHTIGLVIFGGIPATIPDILIASIEQRVSETNKVEHQSLYGINKGEEIKIHSGLFKGYDGIFDVRLPGSERVRVLLKLLNSRFVPLEISPADIKRKRGDTGDFHRK